MAILYNDTTNLLQIELDTHQVDKLVYSALNPHALKRAQRRAINETTTWMRGQLLKDLSGTLKIPRKILNKRILKFPPKIGLDGMITGKIWLGAKPIEAMAFKDKGPTAGGYQAGGHYFAGGFKAKMPSGKVGIFVRKGTKRLPIELQKINIDIQINKAVRRLIPRVEEQLLQKMNRLVSWELEQAAR